MSTEDQTVMTMEQMQDRIRVLGDEMDANDEENRQMGEELNALYAKIDALKASQQGEFRQAIVGNGLAGYVAESVLSEAQAAFIRTAIAQGKNVLITGSSCAGKTTLCNVLLNEWAEQHPEERMLVVEPVREMMSAAQNIQFQLEPQNSATEWAGIIEATHPNAMSVGEIRNGMAAKALLGFWRDESRAGFATIHCGTPAAALGYLRKMLAEETNESAPALLAEAIDYILHLEKRPAKRFCRHILMIVGYDTHTNQFKLVPAV